MLEKICEKYKKERVCIGLFTILLIINIMIILSARINIGTFTYKEDKFKIVSSSLNNIEFKDKYNNKLRLSKIISEDIEFDFAYEDKYAMTYKGKTTVQESDFDNVITTLSNGSKESQNFIYIDTEVVNKSKEATLINKAIKVYKNLSDFKENSIYALLMSVVFALLGSFSLIYPNRVWELKHCLDVEGGEPTEFAIKSNQFGGIIFCIMSLVTSIALIIY